MNIVDKLAVQVISRFLVFPFVLGAIILIPAGTFDYWQVYVYLAVTGSLALGFVVYFLKTDRALVERRMRTREKESTQKAVVFLMALLMLVGYILPGLDHRFGWSQVSPVISIIAVILVGGGYSFISFVMKTNSYASRIVEVEDDQKLIDTGPYSFVRHPMYSGVIVMYLATPVALGSWWGLLPFILLPFLIVPRIFNEEKVLNESLPGYTEYCQRVRWRLLPLVW